MLSWRAAVLLYLACTLMLLLNGSGTVLLIGTTFALIYLALAARNRPLAAAVAFGLLAAAFMWLARTNADIRFISILNAVYDIGGASDAFADFFATLMNQVSGGRLATVLVGYSRALSWPSGFGSWSYAFQDQASAIGLDLSQIWYFREQVAFADVKPNSIFALLVFDGGILGLLMTTIWLHLLYIGTATHLRKASSIDRAVLYGSTFLLVLGGGVVSSPVLWCMAALSRDLIVTQRLGELR